jgi:glycosyltransferase involved in cell wall biosynthesis
MSGRVPTSGPPRVLVALPWGVSPGYCGPVRLFERLFGTLVREHGVRVGLVYAATDGSPPPTWVEWSHRATRRRHGTQVFTRPERLRWAWRSAVLVVRDRRRFDVLHVHGHGLENLAPALAAVLVGRPFAYLPVVESPAVSGRGPAARARRWVRSAVVRRAAWGFALSPGIQAQLVEQGVPPERVVLLGNPVDAEEFRPAEHRTGPLTLGLVGRMGVRKRADLVVEAVGLLRQHGVDASALLVGPFDAGTSEADLRALVARLGLDDVVTFTGDVPDVARRLREVDVFVLVSHAEGLPGALVEAMSCGVPAVVSRTGGMADVVERYACGVVVDPSAAAVADAVGSLAADPGLRARMGENARDAVLDHFSTAVVARTYLATTWPPVAAGRR